MKSGRKNIITSRWLRSLSLLVLIYFSQVYPSFHLHHIHEDGLLEFEISSHPITVEVEHSSDHHHDGDRPHTNDHQHTYDKHINWHVIRQQTPTTITLDDQSIFSSIPFILTDENNAVYANFEDPLFIDSYYAFCLAIRGPPLFG